MADRIGLYGGAFDPFHLAHRSVVESMLASGAVDELWLIPTHTPAHRPQTRFTYRHRLRMTVLGVQDLRNVGVLSTESHLPKPSYMIRTLEHLKSGREQDRFFLCMGEDSLATFTTWHRHQELLDQTTLLVAQRPGVDLTGVPEHVIAKTVFVEHSPVHLSSTDIRERLDAGADPGDWCPAPVASYIRNLEGRK